MDEHFSYHVMPSILGATECVRVLLYLSGFDSQHGPTQSFHPGFQNFNQKLKNIFLKVNRPNNKKSDIILYFLLLKFYEPNLQR